jgi:hypothetical protein
MVTGLECLGHGSDQDSVYIDALWDHYYRPYRGQMECCCGAEQREVGEKWTPVLEYISRCDYRGANGNDATQNFEAGCGLNMLAFTKPDELPNKEEMCWSMSNFGRPYEYLYGEVAPYAMPKLEVPFCQGGEGYDWHGCVIQVDSKAFRSAIVMVSPGKVEPRRIDDIAECEEIYDIEVAEPGLRLFKFEDLDLHGHDTDFVRIQIPAGQDVHIQVIDIYSCTVSNLVSTKVPSQSGDAKKKLRKMLK